MINQESITIKKGKTSYNFIILIIPMYDIRKV